MGIIFKFIDFDKYNKLFSIKLFFITYQIQWFYSNYFTWSSLHLRFSGKARSKMRLQDSHLANVLRMSEPWSGECIRPSMVLSLFELLTLMIIHSDAIHWPIIHCWFMLIIHCVFIFSLDSIRFKNTSEHQSAFLVP